MIELNAISSDSTNLTIGDASSTSVIDHTYYPHGKSEADGAGTATMSFDDFLDMINPLQHIPVVSSIYRGIVGDTINPVSRIVGDALYGGALGLASAGVAALGAIGDEAVAANNGGQTASSAVIASLFGTDSASRSPATQLADATSQSRKTDAPQVQMAGAQGLLQTPAPQSPILQTPPLSSMPTQAAAASTAAIGSVPAPSLVNTTPAPGTIPLAENATNKAIPLDRSKMAYGGVMDSSMMESAQQNQTLALAMAGKDGLMQAQRTMRSGRFATANATAATAPPASPPATAQVPAEPATQAAMQNLIQELQAMKSINQYKNAAQSTPIPGGTLDITN